MLARVITGAIAALTLLGAGVASSETVEIDRGQTRVVLDTETLAAAGLVLSGVSEDVINPGSLEGSVAFGINSRDATDPLLPTTFSYDPIDFLGTFAGTLEHLGSVFFNDDSLEVGNFTIGYDAGRVDAGTGASGFFVASTVGLVAPLFDVTVDSLSAQSTSLEVGGDLLVSPELAAELANVGLIGADVGDYLIEGEPEPPVLIERGQTSVALDLETLASVGLVLSGVSDDVIIPGSLESSVAFGINSSAAEPPLRPTTFGYDPSDFLGTFSGTIEHLGSVFFNEDALEVGNFTIGYDAGRVDAGTGASGFFVASTVGLVAPLFDVTVGSLSAESLSLEIGGDLLVSPELATVLEDIGLIGADVGDFLVEAKPKVQVETGRTSVALDLETLSSVGLDLSSVSDDVIVPGDIDDSVAFGINPRDAEDPDLPTTFAYNPANFLGTFEGTIEHTGSVFFNEDSLEVGNFQIAFDAERIDAETGATGFYVQSTTGLVAPVFDVGSDGLEVDPRDTGLNIAGALLVSPELADNLKDPGLTGAKVGDFLVFGLSVGQTEVNGGKTSVALDLEALSGAGLDLSGVSDDVMAPGSLEGSVAFGINARDAEDPLLPTTFAYDATDFLSTFSGTIEHLGSVLFNENSIEVGNFTIGFDEGRVGEDTSGFFVASTVGLAAPLFDVASEALEVDPTDLSLEIAGDLLVSPELAEVLENPGLAGADVGDFLVEAVPEPGAALLGVAALATLAGIRQQRRRR